MSAKGYWIVSVEVTDQDKYAQYAAANAAAYAAYNANILVRGGEFEAVEGSARTRNVVVEFPSYQTALDCYHSEAYATAKALRDGAADVSLLIIEGYDGPQPALASQS